MSIKAKKKIIDIFIVWLIFLLTSSWFFSGWPQVWQTPLFPPAINEARAVVPAGIIVAWPGASSSIPAGWYRVTALDDYFLEGTTSTPSNTPGGNATHTHASPAHTHTINHNHAVPVNTAVAAGSTTGNSTGGAKNDHTHAAHTSGNPSITSNNASSSVFGTASNTPPYTEVIWIKSSGTADIPVGAWSYFNSDTLPANWTRQSGNRFLKGTSGTTGGTTGGNSDAHSHADSGHIHTENAHTHSTTTPASSIAVTGSGATGTSAPTVHTHPETSDSITATETSSVGLINNGDGQPPFYKLNIIQNGNAAPDLPADTIAMWDGSISTIPANWIICDGAGTCPNLNDKFIKGANANGELGTTGGALTHTHTAGASHTHSINSHVHSFSFGTQTTGNTTPSGNGKTANLTAHAHTAVSNTSDGATSTSAATVTASANTDNRPLYKEILYIQYKPPANVAPSIPSLSLNNGNSIILNEGTYKWASSTMTVSDSNGCSTITAVTAKAYHASSTSAGTDCAQNDNNCYIGNCVATTTGDTCTGGADTTVQYDCGFKLWYIADPTDALTYAPDIWLVAATTTDSGALSGTATNTGQTVEVSSLNAVAITTSISYGSVSPGQDTGASNKLVYATTTGNTAIDVDVTGARYLCSDWPTCAANKFDVWNQKYDTNDVTYASLANTLTSTTTPRLELTNLKPTSTTSPEVDIIYWGLNVPGATPIGTYQSTTTLSALSD